MTIPGRFEALPIPLASLPLTFWDRVGIGQPDECWPWMGKVRVSGYGRLTVRGRKFLVHRIAWALGNDCQVPTGKLILHSCDNRLCCNPAHLRPGTHTENQRDRLERNRDSYVKGTRQWQAVLTPELVARARHLVRQGNTVVDVAAMLGHKEGTIRNAVKRYTWRHVA